MATNFPTSLDTLTNPAATDYTTSPSHAGQHANENDAIEALEAKVGTDSSAVTTSHDYKLSSVTSTAKAVSTAGAQTVAGVKTFSSAPVFSAGCTTADDQDIAFASGAKIERDSGHFKITPETDKLVEIATVSQATNGTNTYRTGVVIQCGRKTTAGTEIDTTITFPTAFTTVLSVVAQNTENSANKGFITMGTPTTTGVACRAYDHTGAYSPNLTFDWIAIGVL